MATIITSECINCGACEPECPNTAIYQGGMEWDFKGATHAPLSDEFFYIVPEKCTECVGFFDQEACAAVCPVDCCVPDPNRPETEAVLLGRAKELHPEAEFATDFPSRFKAANGHAAPAVGVKVAAPPPPAPVPAPPRPVAAAAVPTAAPKPATVAPAPPAAKPAAAAEAKPPAPPAPSAPAPAAAPVVAAVAAPAAPATVVAPVVTSVAQAPAVIPVKAIVPPPTSSPGVVADGVRIERRIERALTPPAVPMAAQAPPRAAKTFPAELQISFDDAASLLEEGFGGDRIAARWALALAQPILGALEEESKGILERKVGDPRFFSSGGATAANAVLNLLLYPLVLVGIGVLAVGGAPSVAVFIALVAVGVVGAVAEAVARMREGFLGKPADEVTYRPALYGFAVRPLAAAVLGRMLPRDQVGTVGQDGFRSMLFDEKLERERRYGEVYRLRERPNGYLLELQLPRRVPSSAIKEELGVPDDMPDYEYELLLRNGYFVVKAKITDPTVRKLAAVSPAFPPDFVTQIKLSQPVSGFRHRCRDKVLEIALVRSV